MAREGAFIPDSSGWWGLSDICALMKNLLSLLPKSPWTMFVRNVSIEASVRHWYPTRFLTADDAEVNFALLVLNSRPITDMVDRQYIKNLWPKAKMRVCADGGANKIAEVNKVEGTAFCPDFICGDLDSARKENIDNFKQQGSIIYQDERTDCTDYTKCAMRLGQQLRDERKEKIDTIVTVGGLYGRFDHVMGCVNTLFLLQKEYPTLNVYCIQYCSVFTLLPPGYHVIHVDEKISSGVCGLVPIGCPAEKVTTTGLQWNLENDKLAFGTLISSSNHVTSSEVHVKTDAPLLWVQNLKY